MKIVNFFEKKSYKIKDLFPKTKFKNNFTVSNIKSLRFAKKNELTFFDTIKYKSFASDTEASFCITTNKLEKFLPKNVEKIIVKNVLFELAVVMSKIFPKSDIDFPDLTVKNLKKINIEE